ncbi:glycerophosphodiester phosphodiesterase [Arthrobacter gandavensis]|uniref:glycerophosphodiester phosphodiesterase n=1 Tax=Arthrobacter gandavensis TaxID=169960 RepID=UPI00188F2D9E|nr:glycerophosphodiester phosphodiesterase family protein [Arthrobacter gandavensis]MBF4994707.1 glycerophosphodiester phosphodiesterase [Arthrobacter gandavensis]
MPIQIYAHRGASGQYAEHTRAAYLQAVAEGADGVECDVHLSADFEPVLLHDSAVDRTSNGTGPVSAYTLAQLRELDFSSWKGMEVPADRGTAAEQFLTLAELLDLLAAAGREVGLAVEFKQPGPFGLKLEDTVLQLLVSRGWDARTSRLANIKVSFMSFSPESVAHLRRTVDAQFVCQLVSDVDEGGVAEAAAVLPEGTDARSVLEAGLAEAKATLASGAAGIAGPGVEFFRAHPGLVSDWAKAGRTVRAWTVDEPGDAEYAYALGVREFTTNYPARMRRVLARMVQGDGGGGQEAVRP